MVTEINCYNNMSNSDLCDYTYYVCSYNCMLAILLMCLGCVWCCILGCYYSHKKRRGVYRNLYTQDLDRVSLYSEQEYEEDQGLIIRGKNIYNSPPKYSAE